MTTAHGDLPSKSKEQINLASSANQACVLFATDEWFATAENLLNPAPPVFVPDLFCEQGKVMDGWETRRRRRAGHDWCVVKLSSGPDYNDRAFALSRIELDTAYFTGNQAPRVSVEAVRVTRPKTTTDATSGNDGDGPDDDDDDDDDYLYDWMPGASTRLARGAGGRGIRGTGRSPASVRRASEACRAVARRTLPGNEAGEWVEVLPMTPLRPGYEEGRHHAFEVTEEAKRKVAELGGVTHLRLNYYPDGGVARMKVYGDPMPQTTKANQKDAETAPSAEEDSARSDKPAVHHHDSFDPPPSSKPHPHPELSSELHGGLGLECSNKHYGVPSNLLRPGPGEDMGDGWETARHPDRPPVVAKDPATGLQDTPLKDWSVVKLGLGGAAASTNGGVSRIIVDTRHFKGNFPESVAIDGCCVDPGATSDESVCASAGEKGQDRDRRSRDGRNDLEWFPLLKRAPLTAHAEHEFLRERGHVANGGRGVTHVRVSITPDGGLSRVRIYGVPKAVRESAENGFPLSHL